MTTDELIERAAKAIKPLFDAYCADLDAEDHAREAAEKALAVFEQAQPEPEYEYRIDDGVTIARTFTRSRVARALQSGSLVWRRVPGRAPGPWVPWRRPMSDHTPDTVTVRECFIDGAEGEFIGVDFERWLAEVRATALEEAADRLDRDPAAALWEMWDTERNQYTTPTDALRARAARIREEGRA